LDLFKLEKLTITAFSDEDRKSQSGQPFTVMFNPSSYTKSYASKIAVVQPLNGTGPRLAYVGTAPSTLSLAFTLDGNGVHDMGVNAISSKSVAERVREFLSVAYEYKGTIHEAHFLIVQWGALTYSCRLAKADITYTSFDRGGQPLRAEIKAEFIYEKSAKMIAQEAQLESPDVTHARVVRSGDTLPLLTREIYGSSARYIDVARWNGLDDFRNLTPGQQILFPPIASFERDGGPSGER
jgi:nucleoid-associated protein YgaU